MMNKSKSVLLCLLAIAIFSDLNGQMSGIVSYRDGSPAKGKYVLMKTDLYGTRYTATNGKGEYKFPRFLQNTTGSLNILDAVDESYCGINFVDCAYVRDFIVYGTCNKREFDKYVQLVANVYKDDRISALDMIVLARLSLGMDVIVDVPYSRVITSETNEQTIISNADSNIEVKDGDIQDLILLENGDVDDSCSDLIVRSSQAEEAWLSSISAAYTMSVTDEYSIALTLPAAQLDIGRLKLNLPVSTALVDVSVNYGSSDLIALHNSNEVIFFPESIASLSGGDLKIEMEFSYPISDLNLPELLGAESLIRFNRINHPLRLDDGFGFSIRNKNVASFQVVLNREIDGQFFISDASGRTLLQGPIIGHNKTIEFNQNDHSGLYFVTIQEKENISTEKLVFIH